MSVKNSRPPACVYKFLLCIYAYNGFTSLSVQFDTMVIAYVWEHRVPTLKNEWSYTFTVPYTFIDSTQTNLSLPLPLRWGPRWRGWLRHCATSRKVAGSIPDDVIRPRYGPVVYSASNRNEYQEYFLGVKCGRCLGLTTLPPSCADCLEIWEPQSSGTLRACPGL
jgi:hypothetical protein